ncbi:hypothetical protein DYBT9623_01572 [Dyadobacter sp. CECT 9623]|uniref:Uncharacterized protein n=1 Tax=Dyadobacter linearis TaxID=2823330 RepID=A0ABN7R8W9_9BACT|nr:hypothetical protein DYBT9623_01572 [Dyadobacter sp. CECT 9623]
MIAEQFWQKYSRTFNNTHIMTTILLLLTGALCFALFYKSIGFFEKI